MRWMPRANLGRDDPGRISRPSGPRPSDARLAAGSRNVAFWPVSPFSKATLHLTRPPAIGGPTGRRSQKGLSLLAGSLGLRGFARSGSHLSECPVEVGGLSSGSQFAGQFDETCRLGAVVVFGGWLSL